MSALRETPPKLLTAEEVLDRMGRGRWELVRGEVRELMPTGWQHGGCTENIAYALSAYVRAHRLGRVLAAETGVLLARDPDTIRGADVSFIARDRLPEALPVGWVTVIPDLVVEVVSPSDPTKDLREKTRDWLEAGVRLLWVVYPRQREVLVYRPGLEPAVLTENDTLEADEVVPGFALSVREIFD